MRNPKPHLIFSLNLSLCLLLIACNSEYTFKKRGYFKIELPAKEYKLFEQPGYPYTFEYPTYANIIKDSTFFESEAENPWWINIDLPRFNGRIYISYNVIGDKIKRKIKNTDGREVDTTVYNTLQNLVNGSYNLTYKHTYKASGIDDSIFVTPNGVQGIYFRLGGNTATANQFLVTDSVKNFLRGALYFDATPNEDSLGMVNEYLRKDLLHLVNTFQWKNNTPK
jgi:gliding motility-associated lipoprotein GldD